MPITESTLITKAAAKAIDAAAKHNETAHPLPLEILHYIVDHLNNDTDRINARLGLGKLFSGSYRMSHQTIIRHDALMNDIIKGNPDNAKKIVEQFPVLLTKPYSRTISDATNNEREFLPGGENTKLTAFKLMLWLKEPMRDGVLAAIPKNNCEAEIREEIERQKNQFMDFGLTYRLREETHANSKGYDFALIPAAYQDYANNYDARSDAQRDVAWLNIGKLFRDVPFWMAQLICNASAPLHDLTTFDKDTFRAGSVNIPFWATLFGGGVSLFDKDSGLGLELGIYWREDFARPRRLTPVAAPSLAGHETCARAARYFGELNNWVDTDFKQFMPKPITSDDCAMSGPSR